jgi:virulence factor Mce-like protein
MSPKIGRSALGTIATLVIAALVVVVAVGYLVNRSSGTKYSAMFTTAIGLSPQADVRILGVPVGSVDTVEPEGTLVRVNFHVSSQYKLPADAKAVLVTPTVVADRYLQILPVYTGGPAMPAEGVIPNNRTAIPAEYDDLLAAAKRLSVALGPQGVNKNGALSNALTTLSRNLNGNGPLLNTALDKASQAITTLSASRNDLAGTVNGLQSFTTNLKQNDGRVRAFTEQFAQVSHYLAGERSDLDHSLRDLSGVLRDVARFVRDNRSELRNNVDQISDVLGTINANKLQLDQVLDVAPLALDGLVNAYNASSGTLDTRPNVLPSLVCSVADKLPAGLGKATLAPLAQALGTKSASDPCVSVGTIALPPMSNSQASAVSPMLTRMLLGPMDGSARGPSSLAGLLGAGR